MKINSKSAKKTIEKNIEKILYYNYDDAKHLFTQEGFLTEDDKRYLFEIGKRAKTGVEIGSFKGLSSCIIGYAMSLHGGVLYCIDTFKSTNEELPNNIDTFEEWNRNIATLKLEKTCIPLIGFSSEMIDQVPNGLDFVFVDGSHDEKSVEEDANLYFEKLGMYGIISFHDYKWESIGNGINKFLLKSENAFIVGINGSAILEIQKASKNVHNFIDSKKSLLYKSNYPREKIEVNLRETRYLFFIGDDKKEFLPYRIINNSKEYLGKNYRTYFYTTISDIDFNGAKGKDFIIFYPLLSRKPLPLGRG